jgi:hypothetical protein
MHKIGFSNATIKFSRSVRSAEQFEHFREGKSVEEIEKLFAEQRTFAPVVEPVVKHWIALQHREQEKEAERQRIDLEERSVAAAERSATAAERSARWAKWSMAIAAAALIVAAWPYIRTPSTWWPF